MNQQRLFVASCFALVATAFAFSIRTDIIPALKVDFGLTDTDMGHAAGPGIWGVAVTVAIGSLLLDKIGMGRLMAFAFVGHVAGVLTTIFAQGFWSLFTGTLFIGLANGTVEAVINPLGATLYPNTKTKHLNILHAWWPGGLIIGGMMGFGLTKIMGLDAGVTPETLSLSWKIKMCFVLIPTIIYGVMLLGQRFPETERVASGVSYREMLREAYRPLFILLMFLMVLTAATELGPDQWVGTLLQNLVGMQGVLLLVYTAGIMFVLRQFFSGPLVKFFSPLGLLALSSVFSAIGLYWLSSVRTALMAFAAATIFGIGKTYFWPTMLGITSERFPKGGAAVLGLLGATGSFSAGFLIAPAMGFVQDHYALAKLSELSPAVLEQVVTEDGGGLDERKVLALTGRLEQRTVAQAKEHSAVMTFRWIAVVPVFLTVAFGLLFFYFRSKGGYRAVKIESETSESRA